MKNLTTPQSILYGFGLVALAIASVPYSSQIIKPAFANSGVHKIAICEKDGYQCMDIFESNYGDKGLRIKNFP